MKKALYIGGFDMPDNNAAAHRVLSVAKVMHECSIETRFIGLSRQKSGNGYIDGFEYTNLPYPKTLFQWKSYLLGDSQYTNLIDIYHPDMVLLYNHPAFAIENIIKYCHKREIKVIGDITEWEEAEGNPIFKAIKGYDINRRMLKSNLQFDGLICISKFLTDYYDSKNIKVFNLPPLVDLNQSKWHKKVNFKNDDKIRILYAGSAWKSKDRIDLIAEALDKVYSSKKITLEVIGITKEQFQSMWGNKKEYKSVNFHGRIPHSDVIQWLLSADFQILLRPDTLKNKAGFPTKFVETITSRTLPVTNLNSNLDDYIIDGKNGFVIPSLNQKDIDKTINRILAYNKGEIDNLKSNIIVDTFDYRKYIEQFQIFINNILDV